MAGAAATFLAAGNANAAMEVATLAASDSRAGLLATLAVPAVSRACMHQSCSGHGAGRRARRSASRSEPLLVQRCSQFSVPQLGWVLFNILGPFQNQLSAMSEKNEKSASKKRSVAAGLGLGAASLLAAQNADAAQQVADLAAGDNRVGILATLAVPAVSFDACCWHTSC